MRASDLWTAYTASPAYAAVTSKRKPVVDGIWHQFIDHVLTSRGDVEVQALTSTDIAGWLDVRSQGRSPKTYDELLRVVRQVYKGILSRTGLQANPALEVPARRKQCISRKPYSRDDVAKMVATATKGVLTIPYRYKTRLKDGTSKTVVIDRPCKIPHHDEVALAILLGAYCGMRLGDAVAVNASQYQGGCIRYTPAKTVVSSGKEVVVPVVHGGLKEALERCHGWLTPHLLEWHRRCPSDVCRLFKRVFRACGFQVDEERDGCRRASTGGFHALRHSFVTWAAERGVPIDTVAACVGHSSTITTKIYNHVSAERKARELAALMA